MRCRSCDSSEAKWVEAWEEYYCQECLDAIYDTLDEYDEILDDYEHLERDRYD